MTDRQSRIIRRAAMTIAALGLLIPVTVSPGQGVEANEACADGACCREMMSLCPNPDGTYMNHYYSDLDGNCATTATE